MALSDEKIKGYVQRLLLSRMRILCSHGFYGLLLMHMIYSVDEEVETACTDGVRIIFGIKFLEKLSDEELDFVMMHEILHVALRHCLRGKDCNDYLFNIACDIVVNSNILRENGMRTRSITIDGIGESMHLAPNGKEGHLYTAEEVYEMLISPKNSKKQNQSNNSDNRKSSGGNSGGSGGNSGGSGNSGGGSSSGGADWDDHGRWGSREDIEEVLKNVWAKRVNDAAAAMSIRDPSNSHGLIPLCVERLLEDLGRAKTDWRTVLNEFVQEEVNDYSFSPPDRRFDGGDFFLPDFNEKDDFVENILFMVDTSGSMSDKMVAAAFTEIKGAIDQFDGKLRGLIGFFDAAVVDPTPFSSLEEFRVIKPRGGGGTSFDIIFEYVHNKMEVPPACIIILTDGYAPFPKPDAARDIPVLWLLNNGVVDPPWGKIARIEIE